MSFRAEVHVGVDGGEHRPYGVALPLPRLEAHNRASLAGALYAAQRGASVLRVHDVPETVDVLRVFAALNAAEGTDAE